VPSLCLVLGTGGQGASRATFRHSVRMNRSFLSLSLPGLQSEQTSSGGTVPPPGRRAWLAQGLAVLGLVVALVVVHEPVPMLMLVVVAALGVWAGRERARSAGAGLPIDAPTDQPEPAAARTSAEPSAARVAASSGSCANADIMLTHVVPIWERQVFAARDAADQGLARLLETFSGVSTAVDELSSRLAAVASGGALDGQALDDLPALQALQSTGARAFAERDAAMAMLGRVTLGLSQLQQSAKAVRELSRHARLVAFNASIEAQRGGGVSDASATRSGASAVADEIRMLATRLAESAEQVDQLASSLMRDTSAAHREGTIGATNAEELRLELQLRAREVLLALGGELGSSLAGSGAMQQVSTQLSEQITEAFMHFQFGDRLSQMLAILGNDMGQLVRWVQRHPVATREDAAEWLQALEASYTMDEQRSQHHGNVHVERSAGVDFF
jgi:methyl-accepting chemotaxis protein